MKISICIPTFNRTQLVISSFINVLNDDRVDEFVIVDDHSNEGDFTTLRLLIEGFNSNKIKLFRNEKNLDCYRNKREAVSKAKNDWVIILDSDNVIEVDYLDALPKESILDPDYIYQPCFAKPHFDFRKHAGLKITKANVSKYLWESTFETMLNACNYFVNKKEYLRVWDKYDNGTDPVTSDSIFVAHNWLKEGNTMYVVPDMEYEHRVHDGSHYRNNVRRTPRGFHESIVEKLKQMR